MKVATLRGNYNNLGHLMPHRVREVLLVSSPYEAFVLEEDGYLSDRIFAEYKNLNLTSSPRVTHVSTATEALDLMEQRRFELVVAMTRLSDMDIVSFGREVKRLHPDRPVVLLALDEAELATFGTTWDRKALDGVFLWTGDAGVLLAIIKVIEDKQNIDHDLELAGVRVIIVVEDTVRYYSKFLAALYYAVLEQAQSLIEEGLNDSQKLYRMRTRPKILLADNFDDAWQTFQDYEENVIAVISDIRYPRGGVSDPEAGYRLADQIRERNPGLSILLQSADPLNEERAHKISAHFVDKRSNHLLREMRTFLQKNLGFGDFIFRYPGGREAGHVARSVAEMTEKLKLAPLESLRYHASNNHISTWLMARAEFEIAGQIRPLKIENFKKDEDMRRYLVEVFEEGRLAHRRGVIAEFKAENFTPEAGLTRLGSGSLGGKARGLAFLDAMLHRGQFRERIKGLPIQIPATVVLCTDVFDAFLEENHLREFALQTHDDAEIARRFAAGKLPEWVRSGLRVVLRHFKEPLAVRSSSLLEDSTSEPFAGIYATYMIANCDFDSEQRLNDLCQAIQLVFASVFSANARAYIAQTAHRLEDEKMAVILQRIVGQRWGDRFYPHLAGVAQSINHYPVGNQRAEEGVALVALGLGRTVVSGGEALRFSPSSPQSLPQHSSPKATLHNSQKKLWALKMQPGPHDLRKGEEATLTRVSLEDAEKDGTLRFVASVYSREDECIRDSLDHRGPRVVTFAPILKYGEIPLAPALKELVELGRLGMGRDIQLEFAVDMGDLGKLTLKSPDKARKPVLYALQMRPMAAGERGPCVTFEDAPKEEILCHTRHCLGSGMDESISDVVYVKHESFEISKTKEMAQQIGEFNKALGAERRHYMLVGPGRWGSSDPWLGIPVQWSQISGARIIVEASPPDLHAEPSQGSHFFQNITSLRIGYLTLPPQAGECALDWAWLDALPAERETAYLRHVRLPGPLRARFDGRLPRALILKPKVQADDPLEG